MMHIKHIAFRFAHRSGTRLNIRVITLAVVAMLHGRKRSVIVISAGLQVSQPNPPAERQAVDRETMIADPFLTNYVIIQTCTVRIMTAFCPTKHDSLYNSVGIKKTQQQITIKSQRSSSTVDTVCTAKRTDVTLRLVWYHDASPGRDAQSAENLCIGHVNRCTGVCIHSTLTVEIRD